MSIGNTCRNRSEKQRVKQLSCLYVYSGKYSENTPKFSDFPKTSIHLYLLISYPKVSFLLQLSMSHTLLLKSSRCHYYVLPHIFLISCISRKYFSMEKDIKVENYFSPVTLFFSIVWKALCPHTCASHFFLTSAYISLSKAFSFLYGRTFSHHPHFLFLYPHLFCPTAVILTWHKAYFLFMVSPPLGPSSIKKKCLSVWFMLVLLYEHSVWLLLKKWMNVLLSSISTGNVYKSIPCIKLQVLLIPANWSSTMSILLEFLNEYQCQ